MNPSKHTKFRLSAFYDYYLISVVSGSPFAEDLAVRLKNELENIGKKYFAGNYQDLMNETFSTEDHFFKEVLRDLDLLFESWRARPSFATKLVAIVEERRIPFLKFGNMYELKLNLKIEGAQYKRGTRFVFVRQTYSHPYYCYEKEAYSMPELHTTFLRIDKDQGVNILLYEEPPVGDYFLEKFNDLGLDMEHIKTSIAGKTFARTSNFEALREFCPYFKSLIEGVEDIEGWWRFLERNQDKLAGALSGKDFASLTFIGYTFCKVALEVLNEPFKQSPRYSWIDNR